MDNGQGEANTEAQTEEGQNTQTEGQTTGGNAGDQGQGQGDGQQASRDDEGHGGGVSDVPETYEFNMPEGMELDEKAAETFTPVLKELGVTQAQADKLTEAFAGWISDAAEQGQQAREAAATEMAENWVQEMKADETYGGDQYEANLAVARQVVEKIGGESFKNALDETGLGNHPEVFRFLMKVNEVAPVTEDAPGSGRAGGRNGADVPAYERLYPNMNKAS